MLSHKLTLLNHRPTNKLTMVHVIELTVYYIVQKGGPFHAYLYMLAFLFSTPNIQRPHFYKYISQNISKVLLIKDVTG